MQQPVTRRAQIAIEFLITFGFLFFIFILFLGSIAEKYQFLENDKNRLLLKEEAYKLREEIVMANSVENGFHRSFIVPSALEGLNYSIQIINQTVLVVESSQDEFSIRIPPVNGTFVSGGANRIDKKNGIICLNAAC